MLLLRQRRLRTAMEHHNERFLLSGSAFWKARILEIQHISARVGWGWGSLIGINGTFFASIYYEGGVFFYEGQVFLSPVLWKFFTNVITSKFWYFGVEIPFRGRRFESCEDTAQTNQWGQPKDLSGGRCTVYVWPRSTAPQPIVNRWCQFYRGRKRIAVPGEKD